MTKSESAQAARLGMRASSSLREALPPAALRALGGSLNWDAGREDARDLERRWTRGEPDRLAAAGVEAGLWREAEAMLATGLSGGGSSWLREVIDPKPMWSHQGLRGRTELAGLPVFWGVTQIKRKEDPEAERDASALIFLAALRIEPAEVGPARSALLFGSYAFEGLAIEAEGRPGEATAERAKCGVFDSLERSGELLSGLRLVGRAECLAFVESCPLWAAREEFLSPAFYERRELESSAKGAPARRGPGL